MLKYMPRIVIPRRGKLKSLEVAESNEKIMLSSDHCSKKFVINRFIDFKKNDFVAIGLYLAEGNKAVSTKGKTRHSGEISFTNSYLNSVKCFLSLMENFGFVVSDFSWNIGININYYDGDLAPMIGYWSRNLGLPLNKMRKASFSGVKGGRLSDNTFEFGYLRLSYASVVFRSIFLYFINKIFGEVINSNDKISLANILRGYFAGDGHVSSGRNSLYNRRQIEFLCNCQSLFYRIYNSLLILGLTNIKQTYPEKTKTHTKAIRIYNKHDFFILNRYNIPSFVDYKSKNFDYLINSYKS